jgi:hypothetical protein
MMLRRNKSKKQFVAWVKKHHPKLYRKALAKTGQANMGAVDVNAPPAQKESTWLDTITSTIKQLAPSVLQFQQQKKLMDMQLKRAEAGLPPASVDQYTPVLRVQTDLAPETRKAVMATGMEISKPIIYGGLGLLGLFLYLQSKKRR